MSRNTFFILIGLSLAISISLVYLAVKKWGQKPSAGLQVITNEIPASVFVAGQFLNKSPLIERSLKPGSYLVRIVPEDESLAVYETSVDLENNTLTAIIWTPGLTLEKSGGVIYEMKRLSNDKLTELSFITVPDNAVVAVEGYSRDLTPLTLSNIAPGNIKYEITLPSYETQSHTVSLNAGFKVLVSAKLARLEAPLPDDQSNQESSFDSTNNSSDLSNDIEENNLDQESLSRQEETSQTEQDQRLRSINNENSSANESTRDNESPSQPPTNTLESEKIKITSTGFMNDGVEVLRFRAQPNTQSQTLNFIPVGNTFVVLQKEQGWVQVEFDGQKGWISTNFTQSITNP